MIGTLTQRHLLPMMTPAAILTRVGRIHSYVFPASFFRFAGQFAEKFRPGCIVNALSQAMIMRHAVDMQVFDADDAVGIDNLSALLVREIVASEGDPLMHTCHSFA